MHIHILGPSGAGISSLGQALSKEINIPYFDSDDIFWESTNPPFTAMRSIEQRQMILRDIDSSNDSWIIGGSMLQWGDFLRDKLDLIVYVYIDKEKRISRLRKREKLRFGDRILKGNDMYDNHQAFIGWAESYEDGGPDMRSRMSETAWISRARCKVVRIENEISIEEEIELVKNSLRENA